jgi:hypothetical protein
VSLQQKLKTFSELSSSKLSTYDEKLLYKENIKEADCTKLRAGCDNLVERAEMKAERTGSVLTDDRTLELTVTGPQREQKGKGLGCVQEDSEVRVLHTTRRTACAKNDSNNNNNNNNNNGELNPFIVYTIFEVLKAGKMSISVFWVLTP